MLEDLLLKRLIIIKLLRTQEMNTCVPEIKENYYTFADELYIFDEATYSNRDALEFETAKKIDVLMPVMEYNWENYHSSTNNAGRIIIPAKEIVNHLKLISQPQTFDLHDNQGKIANLNFSYHNDFNNSHNFVYIRKDLFDKYLLETNSKFIWIIWGERGLRFKTDERKEVFFKKYQTKEYQSFEQLFEYKS